MQNVTKKQPTPLYEQYNRDGYAIVRNVIDAALVVLQA